MEDILLIYCFRDHGVVPLRPYFGYTSGVPLFNLHLFLILLVK